MQEFPHTFVHKYSAVLHYVCVPAAVEAGSWYSMSTLKARTFTNVWQFWAKDKAGANWGFLFSATKVTFLGNYFVFKFLWLREQTSGEGLRVDLKVQFNENSYRSFNLSTARLVNKISASSRSCSVCFYVRALSNTLPHLHHFVMNLTKGKQTSSRLISPDPPSWSSAEQNSHAFCLPAAGLRLWVDGNVVIYPPRLKCHRQHLALSLFLFWKRSTSHQVNAGRGSSSTLSKSGYQKMDGSIRFLWFTLK